MKQTGVVVGIEGEKAHIRMQRHTACGDCGACHVSKSQLNLTVKAENTVGAKTGDFVEVNMETIDFFSAVILIYLFPLIALIAGIFGGYYASLYLGLADKAAQGVGAVSGLLGAAIAYLAIRLNEDKFEGMKKYKPVISSILTDIDMEGEQK